MAFVSPKESKSSYQPYTWRANSRIM